MCLSVREDALQRCIYFTVHFRDTSTYGKEAQLDTQQHSTGQAVSQVTPTYIANPSLSTVLNHSPPLEATLSS